ncbi:hypothetical protein CICLE_v100234672mg, partial [Citrus x clementina]
MKFTCVVQFLDNKTILITGATLNFWKFPFDGTVFVEKILRVQPNMKKLLLLLLRAADTESATIRLRNDLFKIMKEKWCSNFNSFISEKITLVPGDISCEDLGFKDSDLKEKMWNELDIIINSAANK